MKKVAILFRSFGHYHYARLEAASLLGARQGYEVVGVESASRSSVNPHFEGVSEPQFRKDVLFEGKSVEDLPEAELCRGMMDYLDRLRPDAVAIPGYYSPEMRQALRWTRRSGAVAVLMHDSKSDDKHRYWLVEAYKRWWCRGFDSALVAGEAQREYTLTLGFPPDRVFIGYDVVDNEWFWREACRARENESKLRSDLGLPKRYFLTVCRFVPKKNVATAIEAYSLYRSSMGDAAWDYVICGGGPLLDAMKLRVHDLGGDGVHMPGPKRGQGIGVYYGLAECFILASLIEQWGLVVNEAMACGLPVIVTKIAGAVRDLVQEGRNGWTFSPYDPQKLASLMERMTRADVEERRRMGEASRQIVARWTPGLFAEELFRAIALGKRN